MSRLPSASSRRRPIWRRSAPTACAARSASSFPGHKGGAGADPGLRSAIGTAALLLDVPQDLEGIDRGPSPTPYERAERLAADAYGAARCWFLNNGASQGNHALCLALAGARPGGCCWQRNSHASMIDGLVLSGGLPRFVAPAYDPELGMAHGITPQALERALAHGAPVAGRVRGLADLLRDGRGQSVPWPRSRTGAGVPLVVDAAWGAQLRLPRPRCRARRCNSAPTRCSHPRTRWSAA